jgi:site-specific recombinase XerD
MTSGNTPHPRLHLAESASGNTDRVDEPVLPLELAAALAGYQRGLRSAPLAATTRAKYVSRVRGYLTWLATTADTDLGDPLEETAARDGAVRDWRAWAKTVARLRPATINNTLAAIDDFYTRRGLGPATARREALPQRAPKALAGREVVRYLRAVEHCGSARDTVVALLPFYAGLRVGEVVGLDLDDVALSARKGTLRIRGKGRDGGKLRELPLTRPELRTALTNWLDDRSTWPDADSSPALLLNRRGRRLSDRSARTIITSLGEHVGLGHDDSESFGPHILRHTFATQLLRGGADPVLVADLLGHSDLTNLKIYTQPNDEDRQRALALLTTDA